MAADDIVLKLQRYLTPINEFTAESQVVYVIVELRKLIDKAFEQIPDYKSIKFYFDWTLHTEKSRNFQGIEDVFELIYESCKNSIEHSSYEIPSQELIDFLYFTRLKEHLGALFEFYNLPSRLLENHDAWVSFVKRMLEVLVDQPIKNIPHDNLAEICIIGANDNGAGIRVYFKQPIKSLDGKELAYYQLLNGF